MSGRRIVAVTAHPDDETLACGGTLARLAEAGASTVVVCASRGELGSLSDPALAPDGSLAVVRAQELERAAAELGVAEVHLLGHPDGCLRWVDGLGGELAELLQDLGAEAVITFDADGLYWHPDHVGIHEWVTRAVLLMEGKAPSLYYVTLPQGAMRGFIEDVEDKAESPSEKLLWGISPDAFGAEAPSPDFSVDVTPWADRKLAALRQHRTQMGPGTPFQGATREDVETWLGEELFRRAPTPSGYGAVLEGLATSTVRPGDQEARP